MCFFDGPVGQKRMELKGIGEIMSENASNLVKDTNLQIQETE